MVIDDEEMVRESLRITLETAGYEVTDAENGNVGILLHQQKQFQLIITDLIMPGKEGIETIIELKRDYPGIKIIAISGGGRTAFSDYLNIASELGVTATLQKPFQEDDLTTCVRDCLSGLAA
ncbi:MAG: response regulator [Magnetovibrio sp.]|nr:response regulator [Magnetovibrio sp.]